MTRLTHIVATLLVLALCITACNNDTCYDNGSSLPLATFHVGASQQSIAGLSIMGIGVPGDSLIIDSISVNEVLLPLRASVPQTSFALWRWVGVGDERHLVTDTLTFEYQAVPYFHSIECGTMYNFDIHDVTHTCHGIDSVVMITPLVTNSRTPALRIHFTDFTQ